MGVMEHVFMLFVHCNIDNQFGTFKQQNAQC